MKPKISIIVPVYNVKAFLSQCLDSIHNQTFKDWECVVVDDGSTDGSGNICDEYGSKDTRFRILHTVNGGLSVARNTGIAVATGDYIGFCDSDDWMEPNMLEYMYGLITAAGADIVQVGFFRDYESHRRAKHFVKERIELDRERAITELTRNHMVQSHVWNKLYRRELVGPDFPARKSFEDVYVGVKWFKDINLMICDPTPLYHYRMRNGSIVNSKSTQNRLDFIEAFTHRANELVELGMDSFTSRDRDRQIALAIITGAKHIARREQDKGYREQILGELSQQLRQLSNNCADGLSLAKKLRVRLLRDNPRLFGKTMRLLQSLDLHAKYKNRKRF